MGQRQKRVEPVVGAIRPAPGEYDVVFDTPAGAKPGAFTFRFWVNDTTPPVVRVLPSVRGAIRLAVTDTGAGVDRSTLTPSALAVVGDPEALASLRAGRLEDVPSGGGFGFGDPLMPSGALPSSSTWPSQSLSMPSQTSGEGPTPPTQTRPPMPLHW